MVYTQEITLFYLAIKESCDSPENPSRSTKMSIPSIHLHRTITDLFSLINRFLGKISTMKLLFCSLL